MANDVINGSDLFVFIEDVPVARATSHTLSIKRSTRKTANKDSGDYETRCKGRLDVTASCEGLRVYGDYEDIVDAMITGDAVTVTFGQKDGGVLDDSYTYASGEFFITGFDEGAPDGDNATYTVSFEHASGFTFTPVS